MSSAVIYRNVNMGKTGVVVKASPATILGWTIIGNTTSNEFVKVYDKATAGTSTDTPLLTLGAYKTLGNNATIPGGIKCSNGISVRATNLSADNNATSTAAAMIVNLFYV